MGFTRIIMLLAFFALLSCKREKIEVIDNLHGGKIIVCGHGGSGFQSYVNPYPTNSFVSIQRALEGLNADGVEVDVQMTKDYELYLYHDQDLNVSTNCTGCIPGLLSAEVKECKYDKNMGVNVFLDAKLTGLEEVLDHYSGLPGKYFYFDMRVGNSCEPLNSPDKDTLASRVTQVINKYAGHKFMPVISGDTGLLNNIRKLDNNIMLIIESSTGEKAISLASTLDYDGIICGNEDITKEQVKEAHLQNLEVILFNVKRRDTTIEAIKKSPDVIQTDNIQLLQEVLREYQ